jgi:hypothetical protein
MKTLKKIILLILILASSTTMVRAQEETKKLSFNAGILNYKYFIDGAPVSYNTFMYQLNEKDKRLSKMFEDGKALDIAGSAIGVVGACCFSYDIGRRLTDREGDIGMLVGGGGAMLAGLIMGFTGGKMMKQALRFYKSKEKTLSLNVNINSYGLGLCLNF